MQPDRATEHAVAALLPTTHRLNSGNPHHRQPTATGHHRQLRVAELGHHPHRVFGHQRLISPQPDGWWLASHRLGPPYPDARWRCAFAVTRVVDGADRPGFCIPLGVELATTGQPVLFETAHERQLQSLAPGQCLWCVWFYDDGATRTYHRRHATAEP